MRRPASHDNEWVNYEFTTWQAYSNLLKWGIACQVLMSTEYGALPKRKKIELWKSAAKKKSKATQNVKTIIKYHSKCEPEMKEDDKFDHYPAAHINMLCLLMEKIDELHRQCENMEAFADTLGRYDNKNSVKSIRTTVFCSNCGHQRENLLPDKEIT